MKDAKPEIDLRPYLAAMTSLDNRKRAAAVVYATSELPPVVIATLAERLTDRYRRAGTPAIRDATGTSLSELGRPAVHPVLRAIRRSRRDTVRLELVLLLCKLKPAIPDLERFKIADSVAVLARTTSSGVLKAACGFAETLLKDEELL